MKPLYFVTGNELKFGIAHDACAEHGVDLQQLELDIDEIQGEDAIRIVTDKVNKAYAAAKAPVIVSDDTWAILGLRGFPGAYMKSVNHWFTTDDFLRLTRDLEDKRVELHAHMAYMDDDGVKLWNKVYPATLLDAPKGEYDVAWAQVVSLDRDIGLSIAEVYDKGLNNARRPSADLWHEFAEWYKSHV